jgi:ElaB/YqjD/DUF883 family membrane-anchored ribosome-binding protein
MERGNGSTEDLTARVLDLASPIGRGQRGLIVAPPKADVARRKAKALLRETRARMQGRSRTQQAACDAIGCANTFIREKPLYAVGTVAAVGIFIGALLSLRK